MKDSNDTQTLDAFPLPAKRGRPVTGTAKTAAQRAAEYRKRQKDRRDAGERFDFTVSADELDAIRAALGAYWDHNGTAPAAAGELAENLWRRMTCLRVGEYYKGDPIWSAEALREGAERLRDQLAQHPRGSLSPDDFGREWLSIEDRTLLQWARRQEREEGAATPAQAYPSDPERRNLLGKALNDMQRLCHRHHMLLQQAGELSQLVADAGLTPRLSSPASLLRYLRRHEELYSVRATFPAGGEDLASLRTEVAALEDTNAQLLQRAEQAEAEAQRLRELLRQFEAEAAQISDAITL